MALLEVKQVSKQYKQKKAVDNVSFRLHENTCVALLGPNGAGKTTILRCLAQLLHPTSGTIHFDNQAHNTDIRPYIGYLPQYPKFYGWMSGLEFLLYSGKLANMDKQLLKKRSDELLALVGLSEAKNKKIRSYSGGMLQRLGIAQAIIHKPRMLMLDEPVSSLDPIGRREVLHLMEQLKEEMTIIFSTHILSDADEISDELLLLHDGTLIESGRIEDLRETYKTETIELSFDGDLEFYRENIQQLFSVTDISIVRNTMHVTVKDVALARNEIFQKSNDQNWPLTSFAVNKASLEDMFMKAVQK